MRCFLHDTRGNASLWAAFAAAVLFLLAAVAYTGATLYSTYQTAQTELERAANVSVDASLVNANIRDLMLDIPADSAGQMVTINLTSQGFTQEADGDWDRTQDGKTRYHLNDLQITVSGKMLDISATLAVPLPWAAGSLSTVKLPIHAESQVLYLD